MLKNHVKEPFGDQFVDSMNTRERKSSLTKKYKAMYADSHIQLIIFNKEGYLLESCNSLFELKPHCNQFLPEVFGFLNGNLRQIKELKTGQSISIPNVKYANHEAEYLLNVSFYKDPVDHSSVIGLLQNVSHIYPTVGKNGVGAHTEIQNLNRKIELLEDEIQQLKKSQKLKMEFFSRITHDIKMPLTEIIGISYLLKNYVNSEKGHGYLKALEGSTQTLDKMLNDLLDFAKTQSNQITFQNTDFFLHNLMMRVAKSVEFQSLEKQVPVHVTVDKNIPPVIQGDPLRLQQILKNLLTNAIKFTDKGQIDVSVQPTELNNTHVTLRFTVQDTGIGIPVEKLPHIFNNFERVQNGGPARRGHGLGLAIVKNLTELQGGSVSVESEMDKGTIFQVLLTFKRAQKHNGSI